MKVYTGGKFPPRCNRSAERESLVGQPPIGPVDGRYLSNAIMSDEMLLVLDTVLNLAMGRGASTGLRVMRCGTNCRSGRPIPASRNCGCTRPSARPGRNFAGPSTRWRPRLPFSRQWTPRVENGPQLFYASLKRSPDLRSVTNHRI